MFLRRIGGMLNCMAVVMSLKMLIRMIDVSSLKFWNSLEMRLRIGIIALLLKLLSSISLLMDFPNTENTALRA